MRQQPVRMARTRPLGGSSRRAAFLLGLPLLALLSVPHAREQNLGPQAKVWMGPPSYDNGKCFRELSPGRCSISPAGSPGGGNRRITRAGPP